MAEGHVKANCEAAVDGEQHFVQPDYRLLGAVLLVIYLVSGNIRLLAPVGAVIVSKIVLDLCFHLWVVHLYRR